MFARTCNSYWFLMKRALTCLFSKKKKNTKKRKKETMKRKELYFSLKKKKKMKRKENEWTYDIILIGHWLVELNNSFHFRRGQSAPDIIIDTL